MSENIIQKPELLAPAGTMSKLKTAFHFGADAVYIAGQRFGLRSYAGNFTDEELKEAVAYAHALHKKIYVTVNIFAKNSDFTELETYLVLLEKIGADAVIISDPGVIRLCKTIAPMLEIHLSTQANATNYSVVKFWGEQGVRRVVLARELSKNEIAEINRLAPEVQTEIFVHGAMCISYSGRCLLSNYLNGRDSNRGECVQACRWQYNLSEVSRSDRAPLEIAEDERGTYILNSRDLNLLPHLKEVVASGACSLKIEGRMKSEYYVGCVVNAYRRAIDAVCMGGDVPEPLLFEPAKTSHRMFTTAYFLGENDSTVCLETSKPTEDYKFVAEVIGYDDARGLLQVEMRNRFKVGDQLQVLSSGDHFNRTLEVAEMYDLAGERVIDAKLVQQRLFIKTSMKLSPLDILRRR